MKCHFEQKAARLIFCPDFQSDLVLNEPNEAILDLHLDRLWTDSHNEGVENQAKAADRAGGEHQVEAAEEVDDAAAERKERDARSEADANPDAWKKTECL